MLVRPRWYARLVHRLTQDVPRRRRSSRPAAAAASKLRRPWRFEDYADHLLHVLDKLDLRDVTLIGHSNSAAVAMIAGGKVNPADSRIARIVLADSVGGDPRHNFWRIGLARLADGTIEPGFSMTALYDVFWNLIVHNENFLEEIDQAIYWDAAKFAPHVRVPTLVAAGGARSHLPPVGRLAAARDDPEIAVRALLARQPRLAVHAPARVRDDGRVLRRAIQSPPQSGDDDKVTSEDESTRGQGDKGTRRTRRRERIDTRFSIFTLSPCRPLVTLHSRRHILYSIR